MSRSSATRARRSALGTRFSLSGSSTFCSTDSHGNRAASWNMNDGSPARWTEPRVGASRPATRLSSVDLPQPDAPRMHTNSPWRTVSEMSSRAVTLPDPAANTFVTPSIRTVMRPAPSVDDAGPSSSSLSPAMTGMSLTAP